VAKPQKPTEDPMVASAFDAKKHEDLAHYIEQLTPDQATFFMFKLEAALKKRKLQLTGYIVAMIVWLLSMVVALAYFGVMDGFTGWVFLVPFALVGLVLYGFGRWSDKVGKSWEAIGPELTAQELAAKPVTGKPEPAE
jgi:hypothetical protein